MNHRRVRRTLRSPVLPTAAALCALLGGCGDSLPASPAPAAEPPAAPPPAEAAAAEPAAPLPRGLVPADGQARVAARLRELRGAAGAPAPATDPGPAAAAPAGSLFVDVAPLLGIGVGGREGSVLAEDLDGDDDIDVLLGSADLGDSLRLHLNDGVGTFTDATSASGIAGLPGGNDLVQGDYDGDGRTDVLVLRGAGAGGDGARPDSLLRNLGGGRFVDLLFESGLGERHRSSRCAAFLDYDGDGRLDLAVGHDGAPCALYRNRGDGTFADVSAEAGLADSASARAILAGDFDGDGLVDLFVTRAEAANRLFRNRGNGTFEDVATAVGVDAPTDAGAACFSDVGDDGVLDLLVFSAAGDVPARVFRSLPTRGYRDGAAEAGLSSPFAAGAARMVDLDGDGTGDLLLGSATRPSGGGPAVLWRGLPGGRFEATGDLAFAGSTGALAAADLDGDGDLDLLARPGGAGRDLVLENTGPGGHSATILLEGRRSNRSAFGARIRVEFDDGGLRRQVYARVGGEGPCGAGPLRRHVGVGGATTIRMLEVVWPATQARQRFTDLPVGGLIVIVEGESTPRFRERRPAPLGGGAR